MDYIDFSNLSKNHFFERKIDLNLYKIGKNKFILPKIYILIENYDAPLLGKTEKLMKSREKSNPHDTTGISSIIEISNKLIFSTNMLLDTSRNSQKQNFLSTEGFSEDLKINRCVYLDFNENSNNLSGFKFKENYSGENTEVKLRKVSTNEDLNISENKNEFEIKIENQPKKNSCCLSENQCHIF